MRPLDVERLSQALALAEGSFGLTEPNPRVGCVIGSEDGRVFGSGATQQAGGPHAEVMALRDARAQGHVLEGCTVWVTLEPCAHHGRTPPCCDALVEARVGRVVVAVGDPFPQVAGAGLARLRAAGIAVQMADAAIARAARAQNIGFFSRVLRQRPWVRIKIAASLDGFTALPDGRSQWITGPEARADGHAWRRRAGAVLSGIGTVLADDPRLDVRLVPTVLQPLRVIVDSALRMPATARLLAPPGRVVVATAVVDTARRQALVDCGAEVVDCAAPDGRVDLPALMRSLAARGVNECHVEAGPTLNGALLDAGLVDEMLVYLAPRLLGRGRPMATRAPPASLADSAAMVFDSPDRIGNDLRLRTLLTDADTWGASGAMPEAPK